MPTTETADITSLVSANLPYLRRYARALTGSQTSGDNYAAATLEAILESSDAIAAASDIKVALFRAFHVVWSSSGAPIGEPDSTLSARAQNHMSALTPKTREALLLHAIEGFLPEEIAEIMMIRPAEAAEYITIARSEMERSVAGKVMVIEDEAIIAMDIVSIVTEIGHRVTGIARTRKEAVELAT